MTIRVKREPSEEFKFAEAMIVEAMKTGADFGTQEGHKIARAVFNQDAPLPDTPVEVKKIDVAGCPCEWIALPDADPDKRILAIHGGGFTACGLNSHRNLYLYLAKVTGYSVLAIDYRLAPEHPFPAGLEDCEAAYEWLAEHSIERAEPTKELFVVGDSAGGNLAVALALKLKDKQRRRPDGLILMSPSVDLTYGSASWQDNIESDIMIGPMASGFGQNGLEESEKFAKSLYLQGQDGSHPYASPLNGDLDSLPPVFCVASEVEVLRDDSIQLVEKLEAAHVDVEFHLWPYVYHDWAVAGEIIPEARETIDTFKVFIDRVSATD